MSAGINQIRLEGLKVSEQQQCGPISTIVLHETSQQMFAHTVQFFFFFFAVILLLFIPISQHQHLLEMQQHHGYDKVMLILGTYIMSSQWAFGKKKEEKNAIQVGRHTLLHKRKTTYLFLRPTRKSKCHCIIKRWKNTEGSSHAHARLKTDMCQSLPASLMNRPTSGLSLVPGKLISKWTEMSWNRLLPGRQEINRGTCVTPSSNRKSGLFLPELMD